MFALKLHMHKMNEEMMQPDEQPECIIFSSAESSTTFLLNDHELIHDGKLYDVSCMEKKGDKVICYCERDGEEEDMLAAYSVKTKEAFDSGTASSVSKVQKVEKISAFSVAKTIILQCNNFFTNEKRFSIIIPFRITSVKASVFIPPEA